MVRLTSLMCRVPTIKFRKGGVPGSSQGSSASGGIASAPQAAGPTVCS